MGEPEIVHAAIPPGSSVLELGCGTGRITHPLVALGHPVVAVDESPEMLAHVRGAETVRARIQDLALGRRFGVVLLASHLINARRHRGQDRVPGRLPESRGRRRVRDHPAAGARRGSRPPTDAEYARDGIIFRVRNVSRPAPDLVLGH